MNTVQHKKSQAGFTLTELMIASTIFIIAAVGFTLSLMASLRTHYAAADYYRAANISRNRIQHARTLDFASLFSLLEETEVYVDMEGYPNQEGPFRRTTLLTPLMTNAAGDVICVNMKVEVNFPNRRGVSTLPITTETMLYIGM